MARLGGGSSAPPVHAHWLPPPGTAVCARMALFTHGALHAKAWRIARGVLEVGYVDVGRPSCSLSWPWPRRLIAGIGCRMQLVASAPVRMEQSNKEGLPTIIRRPREGQQAVRYHRGGPTPLGSTGCENLPEASQYLRFSRIFTDFHGLLWFS